MVFFRWSLTAGWLLSFASAATPDQWRSRSIYQVLTDRFWRPDNSTTSACDVTESTYCGGTWKGIEYKLDYIQGLGADAVWISPVTKQVPDAYHGYSQTDLYALNEHFGTAQDLKDLSNALHARGMYLMLDVVINHFGSATAYPEVNETTFVPFNSSSFFHPYCVASIRNATSITDCWLDAYLPDVATEQPVVQEAFATWIQWLVPEYGIDGLRLDTLLQLDKASLQAFTAASGVYVVGEDFDITPTSAYPNQAYMSGGGLLNYPLYSSANNTFVNGGEVTMEELAYAISQDHNISIDSNLHGIFFENQDVPRVAATNTDLSIAKNLLAFSILGDGIPIIYYGQEQHLDGANDPDNREATWLEENGALSTSAPLYQFAARLNRIRSWAISQSAAYTTYETTTLNYSDDQIALRKDALRSILTNAGVGQGNGTYTTEGAEFAAGATVVDMISCDAYTADSNGEVTARIGGGAVVVLMEQDVAQHSGIC